MLDDGRRLEVLAAIGIDVYRLRQAGSAHAASAMPASAGQSASAPASARLIVASAHGASREPRHAGLLAQILRALGIAEAGVRHIETRADGSLAQLPDAPAYLMIGTATARACSAYLSLERQNSATLTVVDFDAAGLPREAGAKRALWQLLKPLVRRLREA